MLTIRPFTPTNEEYAACIAIYNAVWPENQMNIERQKHFDNTRNPTYLFQRLVAEWEGKVVAVGTYSESEWSYRPGKYHLGLNVHPDYERRGIGTAFYVRALADLQAGTPQPTLLTAATYTHKPQAIRFLEQRGFACVMRWYSSTLDVTTFDFAKFAGLIEKPATTGIQIYTAQALQTFDPEWQRKIYELDWECTQDEPMPDAPTKLTFEQYQKTIFGDPNFSPETLFVAVDGDQYVGMSGLSRRTNDPINWDTGFTGVLRTHRRRGIALALKLHAIKLAHNYGAQTIRTGNEEHNPMYQINVQLGFQAQMIELAYEKTMGKDD